MNIADAIAIRGDAESYERQENLWLLADILQCSSTALKLDMQRELTSTQQQQYCNAIQRLNQGEPLAYILGTQPFWTLDLIVSRDTLIPRPDSEILVEKVLNLPLPADASVLDLGTGTGAIGLSIASERPHWQVLLTDIYPATLNIAQANAKKHGLHQVRFALGAWYQALAQSDLPQKFDLIVSNPPYLADDDEHLPTLLAFEPKRALVAEQQGLADIIEIVHGAKQHLKTKGYLYIEHGWQQAEAVRTIFAQAGFSQIDSIKDYGGNDRVTFGRFFAGEH